MRQVAVLTSGGDAPGMNAAVRAIVRTGVAQGWAVTGVRNGFHGLVAGDMYPLGPRDVGGIMQHGGTVLGTARCAEFRTEAGQRQALGHLSDAGIDALVVIGGNGSQTGSHALSELGFPVVGVASTIDNDLYGSETTIGVDTALNVALESIDRLRTTASSHRRIFLVEVMGRHCGYIALMAGIAGGAEAIVIPERETDPDDFLEQMAAAYERKDHAVAVVAEGAAHNAAWLAAYCDKNAALYGDMGTRVTILGHVQRGASPFLGDRLLGTRLGAAAVEHLARGAHGVLIGLRDGETCATPLYEVVTRPKPLDPDLLALAEVLAR